jgi:phenylacetate-coenzyme A ligase PaaK-like adenylate-forming protein
MAREVYDLKSKLRMYSSKEYSSRLLLDGPHHLNPRDKLGKFGITYHSYITAFQSHAIKVKAIVIDEQQREKNKTIYLNRKSLKKYLKATYHDIDTEHANDQQLIAKLNENCPEHEDSQHLRHAGKHNQRPINRFIDDTLGKFFSWLYLKTITSLTRFKARFLIINKEKDLFEHSEKMAARRFKKAKRAPAYRQHLADSSFVEHSKTRFNEIPITTKDNYIKPNARKPWTTHINGKLPQKSKIDTSTGTTDAPTIWERSDEEIQTVKSSMKTAWELLMGERTPYLINAFALGPWATGLSIHEIGRELGTTYSVGADMEKIMQAVEMQYNYEQARLGEEITNLKNKLNGRSLWHKEHIEDELKSLVNDILNDLLDHPKKTCDAVISEYLSQGDYRYLYRYRSEFSSMVKLLNAEKKQITILGYPPFLLDIPKYFSEKGKDFKRYHAVAGVGGQAIGESMRQKMKHDGFSKVTSSYGASDLDINLGIETDNEIDLRELLNQNPQMARELYGPNKGVPMVYRYDPLNYHIECADENDHLIFTCNRENRSSPRVRYDLKDTGRVYAASDVNAMLVKHGFFQELDTNLPYIFIWGRDSTAGYGTCNVPFDELEEALDKVDTDKKIWKRAFLSYEKQHISRFDILLELNDDVDFFEKEDMESFHAALIKAMSDKNEYFAEEIQRLGDNDVLPKIRIYKRLESPIIEPGGQRKQVMVFKKGDNVTKEGLGEKNRDYRVAYLTKSDYLRLLTEKEHVDLADSAMGVIA